MATSRLRRWLRDGAAERRQLAGRGLRLHSEAAGRAALRGTFDFRHRRLRPERHEVDSTEHAGDRPANWPVAAPEIGRASCRERGGQYVYISVVAGTSQKKTHASQAIE